MVSPAAERDFNLGLAALNAGRSAEAAKHFQQAVARDPDFATAHANLAVALHELERYAEALIHFRRAIVLAPNLAEPYNNIANMLVELGRFDEARDAYMLALARAPARGTFWYGLAGITRFGADDARIAEMEALLTQEPARDTEDRLLLHFALAKAYDDCGNAATAFRHWSSGNAQKRSLIAYDEARTLGELDRIAHVFDRPLLERMAGLGYPSTRPIFIVGMPRSGTTLVEQILSAHPDVAAAGERYDLSALADGLNDGGIGFPEIAATMNGEAFHALGARYVCAVEQARPATLRITDKMPWNFRYLGLIAMALPRARVIHISRDPVDTCLSCFSKYFPRHQDYSYDLGELGRYYRAYARLMDHWRRVLPGGMMIDIRYDDLVADPETQTRRLLDHCGLPWATSCLAFEKSVRPVRTASAAQVRQPIYRTAADRWQPYRALVRPLLDALEAD